MQTQSRIKPFWFLPITNIKHCHEWVFVLIILLEDHIIYRLVKKKISIYHLFYHLIEKIHIFMECVKNVCLRNCFAYDKYVMLISECSDDTFSSDGLHVTAHLLSGCCWHASNMHKALSLILWSYLTREIDKILKCMQHG